MFFHHKDNPEKQSSNPDDPANKTNSNPTPPPINIVVNTGEKAAPKKESGFSIALKIVSAVVVLALLGTSIYAIYGAIHEQIYSKNNDDSYILLTDSDFSKSQLAYSQFGTKDTSLSNKNKIRDYALIGTKLLVSESKITPSLLSKSNASLIAGSNYTDISLWQLSSNTSYSALTTDFANDIYTIDLSLCPEGDYLIYPFSSTSKSNGIADTYPYSIYSSETIKETIYSLPNKDGQRKRITLRNNSASPYTVISVVSCGTTLPDNYYDAVLYNSQYHLNEDNTFTVDGISASDKLESLTGTATSIMESGRFKIKAVDSLLSASNISSTAAIALDSSLTDSYCSVFVQGSFTTIGLTGKTLEETSQLGGYDLYPEIRELTGYIDKAGQAYASVTGNDIIPAVTSHVGKESFLLASATNTSEKIVEVLNRF
ncbi:MAG: hypothetical protein WCR56_06445 [Bacilli bacterium]